jgi:glucans biosynthesis protein C
VSGKGGRIHSMDALRASSMLLLIPVHAASVLWSNGQKGAWAIAIYWFVHVFRLPLFFAMSGFFLTLLVSRKGLRETARNRTVRIVVPLAVGLVTLVPLMLLASQATGIVVDGDGQPSQGNSLIFQPSFLWFLWYLLILDGVAVALYLWLPSLLRRAGVAMSAAISHPLLGIALLAIPTALALWPQATWTAAAEINTFAPDPSALAYYTLFFGLGATLSGNRHLIDAATRNAWRWLACAVAATLPAAALFTLHNSPTYGSRLDVHGIALLVYAVATWASLFALIGLANRYLTRPRPALRYLADSSYWIYLSHMPALVLLVALVTATTLGTASQFGIVTAGSLAVSLITYALFVRYTPIGNVLNGPRQRPGKTPAFASNPALPGPPIPRRAGAEPPA